jgi:hypothetical protein
MSDRVVLEDPDVAVRIQTASGRSGTARGEVGAGRRSRGSRPSGPGRRLPSRPRARRRCRRRPVLSGRVVRVTSRLRRRRSARRRTRRASRRSSGAGPLASAAAVEPEAPVVLGGDRGVKKGTWTGRSSQLQEVRRQSATRRAPTGSTRDGTARRPAGALVCAHRHHHTRSSSRPVRRSTGAASTRRERVVADRGETVRHPGEEPRSRRASTTRPRRGRARRAAPPRRTP